MNAITKVAPKIWRGIEIAADAVTVAVGTYVISREGRKILADAVSKLKKKNPKPQEAEG